MKPHPLRAPLHGKTLKIRCPCCSDYYGRSGLYDSGQLYHASNKIMMQITNLISQQVSGAGVMHLPELFSAIGIVLLAVLIVYARMNSMSASQRGR